MAIEDYIKENTAALKELTAAIQGQAKAAPKTTEKTPAAADKGKGKPAASAGKGKGKAAEKKEITDDQVREKFGGYMTGTDDADEKEARKDNVRAIFDHFGVARATEIAQENRAEAFKYVDMLENGEQPTFMQDDGDDTGDGDDDESLL